MYNACLQLTEGLAYLHENGIAHRDLGAENILANLNGVNNSSWHPRTKLYIIDLELASRYKKVIGPPCADYDRPCAPEVAEMKPHDPRAADVWQLGMLIKEALESMPNSPDEYRNMTSLCELMSAIDPERRPSAQRASYEVRKQKMQHEQPSWNLWLFPNTLLSYIRAWIDFLPTTQ
ncbi:kinase-like protein [Calocera viscosa TUFC12733]|uniref:non-specific serine/threonine protein kinase n=1 Tax=Calocera viscosa (strain TUFC12733) TaxID=1330018 RepID=A0A167H2V2_CALVF|nr:kinase-like protein [Calocera viscosa TUFC12733]